MVCLSTILKLETYLKHLRIVYSFFFFFLRQLFPHIFFFNLILFLNFTRFIVKQLPSNLKKKVYLMKKSVGAVLSFFKDHSLFLIRINCEHCNTYPSLI